MVYTYNGYEVKTLGEFNGTGEGQDYKEIRKNLKPGVPWKDPEFSSKDANTLGAKAASDLIFWQRANEVIPDPVFEKAQDSETDTSRFDIIQGALSDCWFLVAVDVITQHQSLLQMVVPEDNSFDGDNSVFHFRFWRYGTWVDVVVDDTLPCYMTTEGGNLVTKVAFARNRENEFWVPFLEKAYAKLYGSYSLLQWGLSADAFTDLSSGVSATLTLRAPMSKTPKELLNTMVDSYERGAQLGLGILMGTNATGTMGAVGAGEVKLANGLAMGHAYSITGLGQVLYEGKHILLVRVRNPWGTDFEWNGAWSDGSIEWKTFNKDKIGNLQLKKGDGEFWMTYKDVQSNFDLLTICHLPMRILKDMIPQGDIKPTTMKINHEFNGIWPGAAGINTDELFKNPQYLLDLRDNKENKIGIIVSLYNKSIRLSGKDSPEQKFFAVIFRIMTGTEEITGRFTSAAVDSTGELKQEGVPVPDDNRETFDFENLESGRYLIIPVYGLFSGVKGNYLLRVYTAGNSKMIELK